MKRAWTLIALSFFAAGPASAEIMQGRVVTADPAQETLQVRRENPRTGDIEDVSVRISNDTEFSGVSALEELSAGDEIMLDANAAGADWRADAIVLTQSAAADSELPASEPAPAPDNAQPAYDEPPTPSANP